MCRLFVLVTTFMGILATLLHGQDFPARSSAYEGQASPTAERLPQFSESHTAVPARYDINRVQTTDQIEPESRAVPSFGNDFLAPFRRGQANEHQGFLIEELTAGQPAPLSQLRPGEKSATRSTSQADWINSADCWSSSFEGEGAYSDTGYTFDEDAIVGTVRVCFGKNPSVAFINPSKFIVAPLGDSTVITVSREEGTIFGFTVETYQINREARVLHYTRSRVGGEFTSAVGAFVGTAEKSEP